MKNVITLLLLACTIQLNLQAQNIGISASGAIPNPSAILDVSATDKGMLVPRMTTVQRNAIAAPATGLLVFDNETKSFWFYNGAAWTELITTGGGASNWTLAGSNIYNNNSGNVGIGITNPLAPLHIKNDIEALRIQGTTPYISFHDNSATPKGFLQSFNNDLYMGTPSANTTGKMQFYLKNTPLMTLLPSGNVGIGTETPANKFTVQSLTNDFGFTHTDGTVTVGSWVGNFNGATGGWFGTKSNHPLNFFTFNGSAQMTILQNGNVGIGTVAPLNKLQIGAGFAGFETYDLVMGDGTHATGFIQSPTVSYWHTNNTNISIVPGTGNLGINTTTPTNKLQIGSVGATGFATNDFAIGNGTNAMAIYQTDASTLIGSTTDIVLKPRNNGQGRVGINTNTPRAPLDVMDESSVTAIDVFYSWLNKGSFVNGIGSSTSNPVPSVSIIASGRVYASEFDAYSDARIKNVVGLSNSSKDLAIINILKITEYTLKDMAKYGNKHFKKVIAQEVEKVYPQVVSKHRDFIPNVYQPTNKIEKVANGWLLGFSNKHNISSNAKKLRVLLSETGGMEEVDIVAIPSANEVVINVTDIKSDKVFVYGEEVDDFRTVDYEGLTTLNISATQEISRLVKKQAAIIENLEKRLSALESKPTSRLIGLK